MKSTQGGPDEIAVIGIGCRLPGDINSPESYWRGLTNNLDAIRDVPPDRWDSGHFFDPDPEKAGKIKNKKGGFIDGVDEFDAEFFGYFPGEATRIDPQQRLLLEVVHEATEDAGLPITSINATRTSVYVGSFMYDYLCMQNSTQASELINSYVAMGTGMVSLANRISYVYDLKGPSMTIDTACSSSLVAVHAAVTSLRNDEADLAIACGVNLILRPESSIMLSQAGFLSPDGYCKSFDASGNGYVRSEGVGVVILKPSSTAIRDGNHIYAVIRGTAVNQDGFVPEGFTVPSQAAQIELLRTAYRRAGLDPASVSYVEAHGPGTSVGDPIEAGALGKVVGQAPGRTRKCLIGSVKSNLGHMEGAAGIAGFIKAVLVAHNKKVPSNRHFSVPNPNIDFEKLMLEVATESVDLSDLPDGPVIGVNSFGAGGTNCHVVLTGAPETRPNPEAHIRPESFYQSPRPTVISAKSHEALNELVKRHLDFLTDNPVRFQDFAFSAFHHRTRYPHSLSIAARNKSELIEHYKQYLRHEKAAEILYAKTERCSLRSVAFMFSGQGGQWPQMGLRLYESEFVFRHSLDQIDQLFEKLAGWSILAKIREDADKSEIDRTHIVQPCVMAIQIALARLLMSYGITPKAVVGHSIGEVAAAHISGALTLEQAVYVIYHRSSVQNKASGKGHMLAIGASEAHVAELIEKIADRVSIAAINGPSMVTVSGNTTEIEQLSRTLEASAVFNRIVRVEVPYHSHHMEPLRDELMTRLNSVQGAIATIPLYSTVTAKRESGEHITGEYWYHNVRDCVRMTEAIKSMVADGLNAFVEVGPHPVLLNGIQDLLKQIGPESIATRSMDRKELEPVTFAQAIGSLIMAGCSIDPYKLYGNDVQSIKLPKNPWRHQRIWFEMPSFEVARTRPYRHPFLSRLHCHSAETTSIWGAQIGLKQFPFLKDHQVDTEAVFPATAHIELANSVAAEAYPDIDCHLEDLKFDSALMVPDENRMPLEVRLEITSNEGDFQICSRAIDAQSDAPWHHHSSGRINFLRDRFPTRAIDLSSLQTELRHAANSVDASSLYTTLQKAGMLYGPKFQCVKELWHSDGKILARVELPEELHYEANQFHLHPSLLDACLHAVFANPYKNGFAQNVYLPHRITRAKAFHSGSKSAWSYIEVLRCDESLLEFDCWILGQDGATVFEFKNVLCKSSGGAQSTPKVRLIEGCYEYLWQQWWDDNSRQKITELKRCILIADNSSLDQVAERLQASGVSVRAIQLEDFMHASTSPEAALNQLLCDEVLDRRDAVVFACTNSLKNEDMSDWQNPKCMASETRAFLSLSKVLINREFFPRLYLVTFGATAPRADASTLTLGQTPLHGLLRVFKNEYPGIAARVIDLSSTGSIDEDEFDGLYREITTLHNSIDESEVALRGKTRYVRVLQPVTIADAEKRSAKLLRAAGGAYRATLEEPGVFDSIVFRQWHESNLAEDEAEIEVKAAGLNFKDVVNAMGILTPETVSGGLAGDQLGLEVAGCVVRCGSEKVDVRPGDEVLARVTNGFAGLVTARNEHLAQKPAHLTFVQAATIPVVYLTAHYGLNYLARISSGETVLIHSAAGGVGTAAIQLAQRAGCKIIATAGTKSKQEYIRSLGVKHVFDSRSLDFYDRVMEVTHGRGVDVVLNSLTNNFITQSIKCLAPFGRFIEIGKNDIYKNAKLNLRRLGENVSFFVVDVDRLALQKPALHKMLLEGVVAMFNSKELIPQAVTEFPAGQLGKALSFMSRAMYHGKIAVTMGEETISALPSEVLRCDSRGCYLITGGASGLGLKLASWLVEKGARHLVLASRSGCKLESDKLVVEQLRTAGIQIELALIDVSDKVAVDELIEQFGRSRPPLRGVIHTAALLEDARVGNMDEARFCRVFAPKAIGAWNLHLACTESNQPIEFFVMTSSISSVLGLFGQSNYASANFFLDALAEYRRMKGLPATSINLGVLGEYAGLSRTDRDTTDVLALLKSHGISPMSLNDALTKIEFGITKNMVQMMAASLSWAPFIAAYPNLTRDSRFITAAASKQCERTEKRAGNLRSSILALGQDERVKTVQREMSVGLAKILDIPTSKVDAALSIEKYALDSLTLNRLRNWILRNLDINYPLIKLLKGPSISEVASELAQIVSAQPESSARVARNENAQVNTFMITEEPGIEIVTPWLIHSKRNSLSEKLPRLFCFHSMGIGASLFSRILLEPPSSLDVFAIQTPGRENRIAEPFVQTVHELSEAIVQQILPLLDRPFLFWGHSFGGVIAFETARKLRALSNVLPKSLIVSGTMPPDKMQTWQNRENMFKLLTAPDSADYLISLMRYVEDVEFIKTLIPIMRKDYPLMMSYRHVEEKPLACPITVFGAKQDDVTYLDELDQWHKHTAAQFELIPVNGDHWFLNANHHLITQHLEHLVSKALEPA